MLKALSHRRMGTFKEPEPRVIEEQKTLMLNEDEEAFQTLINSLESTKVKFEF